MSIPKLPKLVIPIFSDDAVTQLLAVCDAHRDWAMVMLVLETGVRAFEMVGLDMTDVSMETGMVFIRLGKGQKDRTVYVSQRNPDGGVRGRPGYPTMRMRSIGAMYFLARFDDFPLIHSQISIR